MSDEAVAPGAPERPRSALAAIRKNPVVDLVLTVAMAVAIAYAVQLWFVKPYRVPSQSMEQTLHVGDRILAARFLYHFIDPGRGDIIVFHPNGRGSDVFQTDHASGQNYVKRLIGLPNEWVGSSGGKVYICERQAPTDRLAPAGTPGCRFLKESYTTSPTGQCSSTTGDFGPRHLGPDQYLMLGDNRAFSEDSRCWGVIHRSQIIGRAFAIYWPLTRIQSL
jgi:signal peptidase I